MIRSMTGFGAAERACAAGRLRIEIKTVNHRFFSPSLKTPPGFDRHERAITETLRRHLGRGHVTVAVFLDRTSEIGVSNVDVEKARAYHAALTTLQDELDLPGLVDVGMLARFSDIFRAPEQDRYASVEEDALLAAIDEAALGAKALREEEGRRLEQDLRARLAAIAAELDAVEARAPARLVEHRDRLRAAVRELAEQVDVDEDRLAREVAYLAERWDVNEEVVRFRSHVELFHQALSGGGSEPMGKRLAFLVQEMHREANTIGSKANDAQLTQRSITLKEEVERIREQVENVE